MSFCYLFLLPTMTLLVVFSYYPVLSSFYHSFTQWNAFNPAVFVGIQNYKTMFTDPIFITSFYNLFILLVCSIAIAVSMPLLTAELIFHVRGKTSQNIYRLLFVLPLIVPAVVTYLVWQFIYEPNIGLLNTLFKGIGLSIQPLWLGDPDLALFCLILLGFPWVSGVSMLIYLAGLQAIPQSVIDASRIDGATGLSRVFKVDIPLIMGQLKLILILAIIGGLQGFQLQLVLTDGGPGYSTMVPGFAMYTYAIRYNRMGYGCALGVFMFAIIFTITVINIKYIRSSVEYEVT